MSGTLGRRIPTDFDHVAKYPFSALMDTTVATVEKRLKLPHWHWQHDQGREGACVGYGSSMMMSIMNHNHKYDCRWLWNEAKKIDEWSDTNPGDDNGTSVRAACDVLRVQGHVRVRQSLPALEEGISANRWALTVDEIRTAISQGIPCSIGVNWYSNFDSPVKTNKVDYFIGRGDLGDIRGGHCLCIYGASDRRQAFRLKNSWGRSYPLVWLPYETMQRLIDEQGEATLVTDR